MATSEDVVFSLKDKLKDLVKSIVESDDYTVHAADEAIFALSALKDFKCTSSPSQTRPNIPIPVPPQFLCPLSGQLMTDPVILATGQTFDRTFIEKWVNEVHIICPETKQVLSNTILTPNCLLQRMIHKWCEENNVDLTKPVWDEIHDERVTDAHRHRLRSLLFKLSLSLSEQKKAAKEIRQLAKQSAAFRKLFGADAEAVHLLLSPLASAPSCMDPELHEDLITTLLNLSIDDDNKREFGANEKVLSLVIDSLKTGTVQTRTNAAAAIFSMSAIDSNRHRIGKSGAIKYLVDLLDEGHPITIKDAASALFKLCFTYENKARTVREGAVQVILGKIVDKVMVDELLSLLALLSNHPKAVEALVNHGAVRYLLDIVKESTSERIKENCVGILCTVCGNHSDKRKEIRENEVANGTLSKLAQTESSTSRAKRKANEILELLNIGQSSKQNP